MEVLSPCGVFIINVPGVWGIIGLSLIFATYLNPGYALIGLYLPLINGFAHIF